MKKLQGKSFDIRSEMFDELLDQMQAQLIECVAAIMNGAVDGGTITASLDISMETRPRPVACETAKGMQSLDYKMPLIGYTTKLNLKKEEVEKGKIENEWELVCVNDKWVLRELAKQLSVEDMGDGKA